MAVAAVAIPQTQRAIVAVDAMGTLRVVDDAPVNWVGPGIFRFISPPLPLSNDPF